MATAGGFTRGDFEAAEVAQDIADREEQVRAAPRTLVKKNAPL